MSTPGRAGTDRVTRTSDPTLTDARLAATGLALILSVAAPLAAQTPVGASVRGTVVTTEGAPIGQAVIELRARGDSTTRGRVQSGAAGRFQIDGVAPGTYHLILRSIGHRVSQTIDFIVEGSMVRDLGRIRLETLALELETIVVTVERPDVQVEPDRTGYLVEALAGTPDAVVTDALRNIPDVEIEFDGTVRVRGATPAIFINGQPAPISGASLAVFLEQFPADQIERIEVLDAPPARFSAQGSGGIINIVLKQGVDLGVNGSVSASAGTRGQRNASGRLTVQRGPWTANGGANVRWTDSESNNVTLRQNLLAVPTTFLSQDARSTSENRGGGSHFDLRREVSEKSRAWLRMSGSLNGSDRRGRTGTVHMDESQHPTLQYDRLNLNTNDGRSINGSLGWEHAWQPQRHTLEFQVSGQAEGSRGEVRDETVIDPESPGTDGLPTWLTGRDNDNRERGYSLEISYVRPLGSRGRMETGVAHRLSDSREDQLTSRFESPGATVPDEEDRRLVTQGQRTTATWLTANRRFGPFGVMLGARGESVRGEVTLPNGARLDRDEWNLFPSANVSWNPRQRMSLRLGYSQRVNRPGVSVLDPTDRSTDPLNRTVGNPDLGSSLTRSVSMNFNWTGRLGQFSIGPYWRRTTDGWERVTTVDAAGISTTTWENLTSRTDLGSSLSWGAPRLGTWRPRVNLNASRSVLDGSVRNASNQGGQLRWSVSGNVDGTVWGPLTAQGSFGYTPPRDLVQGRTSGQWRADMSFRYRMLDGRSTINLSLQDPLALRESSQEIRDPSVIQTGTTRVPTRAMTVSASYSFGRLGGRGGPRR
jgi:iron complex outermembrane recepter protein